VGRKGGAGLGGAHERILSQVVTRRETNDGPG